MWILLHQKAHRQFWIGCCGLQQLVPVFCKPTRIFPPSLMLGTSPLHLSATHLQSSSRKRTYYDVLGVHRKATRQEIKTAFFKLSKQLHPDVKHKPTGDTSDQELSFVEVNEAYSTLVDPVRRAQYEEKLKAIEEYIPQYQAYRQSHDRGSRFYGFPYSGYNTSEAYSFTRREYDFPEPHRRTRKPHNAKVILSLIAMMLLASALHSYRINSAHKHYQHKSRLESEKNYQLYQQVRERAKNSSIQEQLISLSKRYYAKNNK